LPSTINQFLSTKWWATLAVAIAALATVATIGKFSPEIRRLLELDKRVDSLAAEEQQLERDLAAAEQTHRWLQDEPAYIDAVLRDRLDLRRPDETIFRITPVEAP
jgi:cell division protein FtsB